MLRTCLLIRRPSPRTSSTASPGPVRGVPRRAPRRAQWLLGRADRGTGAPSLVPSRTTLLGLVKHATFVEKVWFDEAVTCRSRAEIGIPATPDESFILDDDDTIATVQRAHREACEASRRATSPWVWTTSFTATGAARSPALGVPARAARAGPALRARRHPARADPQRLRVAGHPQRVKRPATVAGPAAQRDLARDHRGLGAEQGDATAYQRQRWLAVLGQVAPQPTEEVLPPRPPYDDRVGQHAAFCAGSHDLRSEDPGSDEPRLRADIEPTGADPAVLRDVVDGHLGRAGPADRLDRLDRTRRHPRRAGRPSRRCPGPGRAAVRDRRRSGRSRPAPGPAARTAPPDASCPSPTDRRAARSARARQSTQCTRLARSEHTRLPARGHATRSRPHAAARAPLTNQSPRSSRSRTKKRPSGWSSSKARTTSSRPSQVASSCISGRASSSAAAPPRSSPGPIDRPSSSRSTTLSS